MLLRQISLPRHLCHADMSDVDLLQGSDEEDSSLIQDSDGELASGSMSLVNRQEVQSMSGSDGSLMHDGRRGRSCDGMSVPSQASSLKLDDDDESSLRLDEDLELVGDVPSQAGSLKFDDDDESSLRLDEDVETVGDVCLPSGGVSLSLDEDVELAGGVSPSSGGVSPTLSSTFATIGDVLSSQLQPSWSEALVDPLQDAQCDVRVRRYEEEMTTSLQRGGVKGWDTCKALHD